MPLTPGRNHDGKSQKRRDRWRWVGFNMQLVEARLLSVNLPKTRRAEPAFESNLHKQSRNPRAGE